MKPYLFLLLAFLAAQTPTATQGPEPFLVAGFKSLGFHSPLEFLPVHIVQDGKAIPELTAAAGARS